MHVMFRLPILSGLLLLAGAPPAFAESPMPDPIPPAGVGRPLEQIRPWRPLRATTAPAPAPRPKNAATQPAPATTKVVRKPAAATKPVVPVAAQDQRPAKQAVDDRFDPRMRTDDVGKGTHLARKPLGEGAYFGDRHRLAVRDYYAQHPVRGATADWHIGEAVPSGVKFSPVPNDLLARLPALPPGHSYIQLGGEVVLIASGSKMVVDGISRSAR